MFNIEDWCGLTREQLARQHRDRLIEKAKQRREQYRPRQIVTAPSITTPEPHARKLVAYRPDGTRFYQIEHEGQTISLPLLSIQR